MADMKGIFIPDYVNAIKRRHPSVPVPEALQEASGSTEGEGGATTPPVGKKKAKKAPSRTSKKKAAM